jgi:hypothetical protein
MGFLDEAKKFADEHDKQVDQAQDVAEEKTGSGDTAT